MVDETKYTKAYGEKETRVSLRMPTERERLRETSMEEEDLKARSSKKVKGGDHSFSKDASCPTSYADLPEEPINTIDGEKGTSYQDPQLGVKSVAGDVSNSYDDEWLEVSHEEAMEDDRGPVAGEGNLMLMSALLWSCPRRRSNASRSHGWMGSL